jgi:hypothetical protein
MMALMVVGVASASNSYLSEDDLAMAYYDTAVVDYCIDDVNGQTGITVVLEGICRDTNDVYGCQPSEDASADGLFTVVANPTVIDDGQCTQLTLTTTIDNPADGGVFYYTVDGEVGGATIGTEETGRVFVPEFGILAAVGVLTAAGIFINRRRK